jgi:hypothetical protein
VDVPSNLDAVQVGQLADLASRFTGQELGSYLNKLRERYRLTLTLPIERPWQRDEWGELIFAGRAITYYANVPAVAAQNAMAELSNGVQGAGNQPTGKVIVVKRVLVGGAAAATTFSLKIGNAIFQTATIVAITQTRFPPVQVAVPAGSFPQYASGGNQGANVRVGSNAAPALNEFRRLSCPVNETRAFEVPGSFLVALMDVTSGTNPTLLSVVNNTLNQAFDCTIECAEIPFDTYY